MCGGSSTHLGKVLCTAVRRQLVSAEVVADKPYNEKVQARQLSALAEAGGSIPPRRDAARPARLASLPSAARRVGGGRGEPPDALVSALCWRACRGRRAPQPSGLHERVVGKQLACVGASGRGEGGLAELACSPALAHGRWSARATSAFSRVVRSKHQHRNDLVSRLQLLAAVAPTGSAGYAE